MAKILYVGSHGAVDPTRATLPFVLSSGAIDAGHSPQIALLTEAVFLAKNKISDQIDAVGFPPLKEILPKLMEHQIPVYV